ncbi:hypothetical protein PR202_ga03792 [Eleusine coracana subsp. coracana]|uniref:Reverse transcriptase zinc-binding domain-containing protein n=1 Tax=Eleusine coracana subsp. coracana TaxID=191504 RepID=A0AAV5BQ06_ELECO|nr:hypothetical protein PR202_ga03792 [Eleusine coracana subsp. coracana]
MNDRLNTRRLLQRKNMMLDSYDCESCILQRTESLRHLFFTCNFAKRCWQSIEISFPGHLQPLQVVRRLKRRLMKSFFMEIIILMNWCICVQRNEWLFNHKDPSLENCKDHFKQEIAMVIHRAKGDLKQKLQQWLEELS